MITCGDYRPGPFSRKFLKRIFDIREMDILTTAGGSRTISKWGASEKEENSLEIKRQALFIDLEAYVSHGAGTIVLCGHSDCGFWPKFDDVNIEDAAHKESLLKAGKILQDKYPDKKIILLYVVINPRRQRALKVRQIEFSGEEKEINVKEDERLAPSI